MNIIILGPQGSGKGTQAKLLAERYDLVIVESGRLIRKAAKTNKKINETINKKGQLIPTEEAFKIVTSFIKKKLSKADGLLLDGYPRSVRQYQLLKDWLNKKGSQIDKVIFLDISRDESIKRLAARRVCVKCGTNYNLITNPPPKEGCECGGKLIQREDDRPDAVSKRLEEYQKQTKPLVEVFETEGILEKVDGERPIEVIFKDILTRLGI